ncbi:MAG: UDP-N-acetylglucosamine acyltransferase [Verrucomicrobiales bacterium]|jgi:UDP-N-acetylglucosamine acyltransferase
MSSTTQIHPTAIIDPAAKIGMGVEIGPYCVIYAGVEIGDGCWLQNHVTIDGSTKIGKDNRFYAYGSIGQRSQDLKYAGEPTHLEVGDGNCFREFVSVNRGTEPESYTRIGSDGNFLAYSHIAHDCTVGDGVIFSNNGTLAGHVEMGDHAILGGLTAVHQFCRVGRHAITGGCSKIVQDVPPFMIADGNAAEVRGINAVGLGRHGFSEESIRALKEAYKVIYRRNLNTAEALAQLKEAHPEEGGDPLVRELIEFIDSSQRGIIR